MANAFFSDLLSTISERGRTLLRRGEPSVARQDASELLELCKALLSGRGEASGTAMARDVLDRYHDLDAAGRLTFFETLAKDFGPDREKLSQAIESWRSQPNDSDASDLHFASEPQRQELIRRLNRAPGGTSDLVAMRRPACANEGQQGSGRARPRCGAFAVFLVQQGISRATQDRLVDASEYSGTDHPL
jgi:malonyl-CoA decarboxylase